MIDEVTLQNELEELFAVGPTPTPTTTTTQATTKRATQWDGRNRKTKLILSGGGVKGIAHLGALKALQDLGLLQYIDTYAGSSIGAFVAVLLLIGYGPEDQFEVISGIDLSKMRKRITVENFLTRFGLDDGSGMEVILEKMFRAKGVDPTITFQQLYERSGKTLIVTASCLNDKRIYYYSHTSAPDMKVMLAVRMSISLPIYFVPVSFRGKLFVDGGCIDNYPIQLFNESLDQVIGIYLADVRDAVRDIANIEDFLLHLIQCLFEGVTCNSLKGYEKYSIKISLKKISVVDFNLDRETKRKLFDAGYEAVVAKFKA